MQSHAGCTDCAAFSACHVTSGSIAQRCPSTHHLCISLVRHGHSVVHADLASESGMPPTLSQLLQLSNQKALQQALAESACDQV